MSRILLAATLVGLVWPTFLFAADKPNILVVITDDQRWDAMSVVQAEQGDEARFPWFETPNFDRLAKSGTRFRNAFVVNSLCSPSRACFLTGRYNHSNGITDNKTPLPPTLSPTPRSSVATATPPATPASGIWTAKRENAPASTGPPALSAKVAT